MIRASEGSVLTKTMNKEQGKKKISYNRIKEHRIAKTCSISKQITVFANVNLDSSLE